MLTARFYYFQSFKQRIKGNSGFNFSCCLLASQTLHPVTQDILTYFVYYALIFYLLPNFCSKQTKNQALVQKCFLFPCPLTPHTHVLPISKLILESCNRGCSSGRFHLHKKKQVNLPQVCTGLQSSSWLSVFWFCFLRGTAINMLC